MAGAKRKYIEAAYELLMRDGLQGVSIRKVADEVGCSSTALYRHFPDIDKLIAVASVRFLRDYIEDARLLSKVDMNPLELNLQLWECLAYYSFRNADIFDNLFFGDVTGRMYPEAVGEYFSEYPEDLEGMKEFMLDMFMNSTIAERDAILLQRAVDLGMLSEKSCEYLCDLDSYLYRGMLASLCGGAFEEERFREECKKFLQLIIHSYETQLNDGYSILVVSPDHVANKAKYSKGERNSFRVKITATSKRISRKEAAKASA